MTHEIDCEICRNRRRAIKDLNEHKTVFLREKHRNQDHSEPGAMELLDECPTCRRNKKPTAMSDFGANPEQTQHVHKCGICGTRLPKEEDSVYAGTFVCGDLGEFPNGELHEYRGYNELPPKKKVIGDGV